MTHYIEIKLTPAEHSKVERAALKMGMTVTNFLRWALLSDLQTQSPATLAMLPAMPAMPTMPAYPATITPGAFGGLPTVASAAGDTARLRQMVAVKNRINAELALFAEQILLGQ